MTLWLLALVLLVGLTGYVVLAGLDRRREPARESPQRTARRRFASGEIDVDEYRRRVIHHAAAVHDAPRRDRPDAAARSNR